MKYGCSLCACDCLLWTAGDTKMPSKCPYGDPDVEWEEIKEETE